MENDPSEWFVAAMLTVFGLIGLVMAARAQDDEIYLFGLSLAGFSVAFVFGLIRVHYDRVAPKIAGSDHV